MTNYLSRRQWCIAILVLLVMPFYAICARADGFYADIHGGGTFIDKDSARVTVLGSGGSVNAHSNFDPGWLAGTSLGFQWSLGFAAELEFTFRQNHLNRLATSTPLFVGGDMHSYGIMFNGYYRWKNSTLFTPYIGGGVGEAVDVLNNSRVPSLGNSTFGGTDVALGYQGIAGVSYPLRPNLEAALEYRYFASTRPGLEQTLAGRDVKVSPSYNTQNAIVRLEYRFPDVPGTR
jgi:OmpA-OmpF porin, OOP family